MMRITAALATAALVSSLGSGCMVEKKKFDAVEARLKERDAALATAETELAESKRREVILAAEKTAVEKEVLLLKAKMETREIAASLEPIGPAPIAGVVPAGLAAEDDAFGSELGGDHRVNPKTGGIVLDGGTLFLPGSATLRLTGEKSALLDRLAADLNKPENVPLLVRVEGHTDDTPITKSKNRDNWELAGKRALAVLNYLEDHGVSPDRLVFAGHGSQRPLRPGASKEDRTRNRRVEIVLVRKR